MSRNAWILVMLTACGEPVLRNTPKPNTAAVAGVAAAAAAAVTLASPRDAAKQQEEQGRPVPDDRGVKVKETVPGAVFDRLDRGGNDAGVDGGPPAATPPVSNAPAAKLPPPQTWTPDPAPPAAPSPQPASPR